MGCDRLITKGMVKTPKFQSTHPCGVRQAYKYRICPNNVSIHAPVWGATSWLSLTSCLEVFQSTHPCGVRPYTTKSPIVLSVFQSTHPCGVRPSPTRLLFLPSKFQSTHPCGVRQDMNIDSIVVDVSIHAPVWGATIEAYQKFALSVFQSTHPCGVRHYQQRQKCNVG